MEKLIEYGLKDQDFEILLENDVDMETLSNMEIEDIRMYIQQLITNKRESEIAQKHN
jgi:hypothetical protein